LPLRRHGMPTGSPSVPNVPCSRGLRSRPPPVGNSL